MTSINPEWAMVGWQTGGWHWLLASRDLEAAELDWMARQYDFESWEAFLRPGAFRPAAHIDIISAGSFVLVRGRTYADCLADLLFKHGWRADHTPPNALPTHDPIAGHLAARRAQDALEAADAEGNTHD
jgi:hypothetical protein